jgi:hypothetical protein
MSYSCYVTFSTTYFAIRAESLLKAKKHSFKMVPVPRVISSSCGTALRCSCEELDLIRNYLLDNMLELEGFYKLKESGLKVPEVEELSFNE